jgi:RNA polymerase sigma-70 factor (ECF subfamily)
MTDPPTDPAPLLADLRRRDAEAWRAVVRRHHATLVALAAAIVGNAATAEEVAQDAWLAAVGAIGGFEASAQLSTWLCAIALNAARTRARRDGRTVLVPSFDQDAAPDEAGWSAGRFGADGHWTVPPLPFDDLDPERIVGGRQLWAHASAAIERLAPLQRAVLVMRDVEEIDTAEICRLLDITPENQRVLLHRARTRLRAEMERLLTPAATGG